ncbi:MAG: histidine phosphatase family protein [Rhodobacteraceae bacterium]|nr:histidine phosphatase family protein [Paracoccaceae bacterium]
MPRLVRYLSHPQVRIDPAVPVPQWGLSPEGAARVAALARSGALSGTVRVVSSLETKAVETALPLAQALGCPLQCHTVMGENDRSATGFLPGPEFEATADAFFARPDRSVRGWETAKAAQSRIVAAVRDCLATPDDGDLLLVGHGAVGTLLYCHLAGHPIDRRFDQPAGGGNLFAFCRDTGAVSGGWQPLETLITDPGAVSRAEPSG